MTTPEERAREKIDEQFRQSGWAVQNRDEIDLTSPCGVERRDSAQTVRRNANRSPYDFMFRLTRGESWNSRSAKVISRGQGGERLLGEKSWYYEGAADDAGLAWGSAA